MFRKTRLQETKMEDLRSNSNREIRPLTDGFVSPFALYGQDHCVGSALCEVHKIQKRRKMYLWTRNCGKHKIGDPTRLGRWICDECEKDLISKRQRQACADGSQARRLKDACIPELNISCTLDNYEQALESQQHIYKSSLEYSDRVEGRGEYCNLILIGSTGTGKTHIGCALTTLYCRRDQGVYTSADNLINSLNTPGIPESHMRNWYSNAGLLFLDNIENQDREDMERCICPIIEARANKKKSTILASRLNKFFLASKMGKDLAVQIGKDALSLVLDCPEYTSGYVSTTRKKQRAMGI